MLLLVFSFLTNHVREKSLENKICCARSFESLGEVEVEGKIQIFKQNNKFPQIFLFLLIMVLKIGGSLRFDATVRPKVIFVLKFSCLFILRSS